MSKIIIVSVRVAQQHQTSTGGLAVAVECMLQQKKLEGIWLGWNGEITDSIAKDLHPENRNSYTALTFSLTQDQYDEFYCGYANNCLWPAFHYRLDLMEFNSHEYQQYLAINEQMAMYIRSIAEPDDIIWVQDYHLIPTAHYCRQLNLNNRIGFFLHTPFPCADILQAIPQYHNWLHMLLAYDVVGVQSDADLHALNHSICQEYGYAIENGLVQAERNTQIKTYPISIDPNLVQEQAQRASLLGKTDNLFPHLHDRTIIGVDRLDYSKGLPNRFQTFATLLKHYPILRGQVNYVQIAPSTRADINSYQFLRQELETLAGQINGQYSTLDWAPLTYLNRAFPPAQLMGLFRKAKVGYVAPLRDGMNLVAKEYIAAQAPEDPGVLVLSRFTGAAQELKEAALLVNPYHEEQTAHCLYRALQMPLDERISRHKELMHKLNANQLQHWCDLFLEDLRSSGHQVRPSSPIEALMP